MATTFPFPASPTVGQQVTLSDGITKLAWTGYSWEPIPAALAGLPSQGAISGFRNRVINPSGAVQARAMFTTTHFNFICDRWRLSILGGAVGKTQGGTDTTLGGDFAGTPYAEENLYLVQQNTLLPSPAAGDLACISHSFAIEQVSDFKLGTAYAKPLVLSFVARTKPGMGSFVISVALRSSTGDRSFVRNVTINETAQRYTIAVPAITSGVFTHATAGAISLTIAGMCGTTYQTPTPGAWANGNYLGAAGMGNLLAVAGQYFRIREVQLEEGTVPTAFEVRPYGTELELCRRYYQSSYGVGEVPGQANTSGSADYTALPAGTSNVWAPLTHVRFHPIMRIAPVISVFNPGSGAANQYYSSAAPNNLATITDPVTNRRFSIRCNGNNPASASDAWVHWTADAEIS